MAERLISAANAFTRNNNQVFASTRFGNVLGSRGSVVPIFHQQIANGGPVTLTNAEMTRFIMTLSQAVRLVINSVFAAKGGEVFVTKMPVVKIADLAKAMIRELAPRYGWKPDEVAVDIVGSKPGEKMYEELMNEEELRRSVELRSYFSITPPCARGIGISSILMRMWSAAEGPLSLITPGRRRQWTSTRFAAF